MKNDFQNTGDSKPARTRTADLLLNGKLPVPAADQWSLLAEIPRAKANHRSAVPASPAVSPVPESSLPSA